MAELLRNESDCLLAVGWQTSRVWLLWLFIEVLCSRKANYVEHAAKHDIKLIASCTNVLRATMLRQCTHLHKHYLRMAQGSCKLADAVRK